MRSSKKNILLGLTALLVVLAAVFIYINQSQKVLETVEVKIDTIEDVKGLGYSGQRKVAVDNNGNFFVAYRKKYQGKSEIFVAKAAYAEGQWKISGMGQPISQVGSGVDQRVPSITIDSKNNLHAVWYGSDLEEQPDNRQVKYSRSSDGGKTWTQWKNISYVIGYSEKEDYWQEHPYALSGANGELSVVWEGKDKNNEAQQIKFSRSSDGGTIWSEWKNVQSSPGNTQSRPTLVEDRTGKLYLFMYSSDGRDSGRQQIQYLRSDDQGTSWSQSVAISDPSFDSRHVSAVSDASGNIHVAWRAQAAPGLSQIMYRSLENGKWSEMKSVAASERYQFFPSIGVDGNGKINIAWMESDQSSDLPTEDPQNGKVYLSSLSSGVFSAPRELSSRSGGLYPHLTEKFWKNGAPVIYETGLSSGNYGLIFKLVL